MAVWVCPALLLLLNTSRHHDPLGLLPLGPPPSAVCAQTPEMEGVAGMNAGE